MKKAEEMIRWWVSASTHRVAIPVAAFFVPFVCVRGQKSLFPQKHTDDTEG
jgi:hypothetical protein